VGNADVDAGALDGGGLLARAQAGLYRWPEGFAGFSAEVRLRTPDGAGGGVVEVTGPDQVRLVLDGVAVEDRDWCERQLRSLVAHRWAASFEDNDGACEVSLVEPEGSHSLGALVAVADRLQSTYRLRDGRIVEITRHPPRMTVRVYVQDHVLAPDGRMLPRHVTSTLSDPDSGAVRQVEILDQAWDTTGVVVLPVARRVVTVDENGARARSIELSEVAISGAVG
jgi:Protein of unknown function (DUF3386)